MVLCVRRLAGLQVRGAWWWWQEWRLLRGALLPACLPACMPACLHACLPTSHVTLLPHDLKQQCHCAEPLIAPGHLITALLTPSSSPSSPLPCRVIAWEPVPVFRAFFQLAMQYNNVSHLIDLRTAVVSDSPHGTVHRMLVPNRGIWGTAGIDGLNIDNAVRNEGALLELAVSSERLDDVVSPDDEIALLKVRLCGGG